MRSSRIQRLIACLLFAVSLPGGNADAQQAPEFISLKTLVAEALEQNPVIVAMRRNFDMMRARVPQSKALPDPMLSYGYVGNINPLPPFDIQKGDPSSARILNFTQEMPYPGKL